MIFEDETTLIKKSKKKVIVTVFAGIAIVILILCFFVLKDFINYNIKFLFEQIESFNI